jgi:hypothetical protein
MDATGELDVEAAVTAANGMLSRRGARSEPPRFNRIGTGSFQKVVQSCWFYLAKKVKA